MRLRFNYLNVFFLSFSLMSFNLGAGCASSSMKVSDGSIAVQGSGNAVHFVREIEIPNFVVLPEHVIDIPFLREKIDRLGKGLLLSVLEQSRPSDSTLFVYFTKRLLAASEAFKSLAVTPVLPEGQRDRTVLRRSSQTQLQTYKCLKSIVDSVLGFATEDNVVEVVKALELQFVQALRHLSELV